jgi:hypothetical protein
MFRLYENEEPAADLRGLAQVMRQQFVALVHEGFTEQQALTIIGVQMGTCIAYGQGGNDVDGTS